MRKSRFAESQIIAILKEGEAGVPVPDLLRKHGISRPMYYIWKSKYGGARVPKIPRLRELEHENAKLKRMYAELALESTAIKHVPGESCDRRPALRLKRQAAAILHDEHGLSLQRACGAVRLRCDCRGRPTTGRQIRRDVSTTTGP